MVRREPPTPEVDPENAEFVVFFRCLKYKDSQLNTMVGPSLWVPLSIIKGNQVSNFLAKAIETEWGMKLYGRTLIWQMASGLYQDKTKVEKELRKNFPPFANAASSDFQYAFKIRDKANPKDWTKAEDLTVFPSPEELGATGIEQLKKFFSAENVSSMFKAPQ
ncbi:hypothetical protein HYH03_006571 [Edaphochlamys debaryana]|uniref:Uncharacterized protein n=1 Tax=Edaphochlamys debaryana TaxID=47281 RepID=A0A835Y540_9CHLO|nr:hypothetical protein HYH03_006571 [Edaphochlamys debaryana]|eukprot:KAG2495299.1 hypothetical protein HYH03_006571 [Edaphochlamys debaryana]